jgi:hypothetical protein
MSKLFKYMMLAIFLTAPTVAASKQPAKAPEAGGEVRLNFEGAPLVEVVKRMTALTGKNFIIEDSLRHERITILTGSPVPVDEAYQAFVDALQIEGLAIEQKGRFLRIHRERRRARSRRPPSRRQRCASFDGIDKTGEREWTIDRAAAAAWLAKPACLGRQARIVPGIRDGKPEGFKLYAIRRGSLWHALGIKNGDTLLRVAGTPLTTPEQALQIYAELKQDEKRKRVTVELRRRGETRSHVYLLR